MKCNIFYVVWFIILCIMISIILIGIIINDYYVLLNNKLDTLIERIEYNETK